MAPLAGVGSAATQVVNDAVTTTTDLTPTAHSRRRLRRLLPGGRPRRPSPSPYGPRQTVTRSHRRRQRHGSAHEDRRQRHRTRHQDARQRHGSAHEDRRQRRRTRHQDARQRHGSAHEDRRQRRRTRHQDARQRHGSAHEDRRQRRRTSTTLANVRLRSRRPSTRWAARFSTGAPVSAALAPAAGPATGLVAGRVAPAGHRCAPCVPARIDRRAHRRERLLRHRRRAAGAAADGRSPSAPGVAPSPAAPLEAGAASWAPPNTAAQQTATASSPRGVAAVLTSALSGIPALLTERGGWPANEAPATQHRGSPATAVVHPATVAGADRRPVLGRGRLLGVRTLDLAPSCGPPRIGGPAGATPSAAGEQAAATRRRSP